MSVLAVIIAILMKMYYSEPYTNLSYAHMPINTTNYPAFYMAAKEKSSKK